MTLRILLLGGLLLALPCLANAKSVFIDHDYSVDCETLNTTECTVKSNKAIKSVRVELLSRQGHNRSGFVKKEYEGCPTEVSVGFDASPKAKLFIQTCDGSSGVKVIGL
ncbi:MAG: hypothetical protein Q3M24_01710 [Candidatus Electrothrix aestuarii]|uniref:CVNH domain-containing protein n=1 Tax=Candidatus Electrothrix aestuarii TaxID=3062594 RepID=A0AAU8LW37_9BACT|nr:hypothetical protein [Candidatus Electrothrix aestuarii]